ncbi:MAG: hypothetical protein ACQEP1_03120 [Nanobdellota archaeon]
MFASQFLFSGNQAPTGTSPTSSGEVSGDKGEFAACLTENGATFYGTNTCSHCQTQKEMFGSSMENVDFINCNENRQECLREGIEAYPTWKFSDGTSRRGVQPLERLASKTGCEL